jgi:hypothetical protein
LPEPALDIPLTKALPGSARCASARLRLGRRSWLLDNPIARGA